MKKSLLKAFLIILVALIGGGIYLKLVEFESHKPWIKAGIGDVLGPELAIQAGDAGKGLKTVRVEGIQGQTAAEIWTGEIPQGAGDWGKKIALRPLPKGLADGAILIRITAEDRSWNGGNVAVFEKKTVLDTTPPRLTILGGPHYINPGGTGCVAYFGDEAQASSGIRVGGVEFRGFPTEGKRGVTFFALGHGVPANVSFQAVASDAAGNRSSQAFRPAVKKRAFKKDSIAISDRFLADVLPYFKERDANLKGNDVEVFLAVNRDQRRKDAETIQAVCRETAPKALWSGPFLRLPKSKPMAAFGDERTYLYNGEEIDKQIHLGVDLASLAQSKIPAANAGRVAFAGPLGIYGEAVILDHGLGVFSLYAHLSRIDVALGKDVAKEETLGLTGSTGMAGGDHLHFAMLVQGVFVDPVEWWDPHWIKDNVELKMK
jgi:murein DD-endopeptidase MepM/ murein hydrolase activator NlpD